MKIVAGGMQTTLVEATAKKVMFLREAIGALGLEGVKVANTRVEELGRRGPHRGAYDVATVRAVSRLPVIAEYCVPLLGVGGYVVSMKGRIGADELSEGERAARILGAAVADLINVPRLPEIGPKNRTLVVIEKLEETPRKYPRKVGLPAKRPLGVV